MLQPLYSFLHACHNVMIHVVIIHVTLLPYSSPTLSFVCHRLVDSVHVSAGLISKADGQLIKDLLRVRHGSCLCLLLCRFTVCLCLL